jgi:hypothetical protein
MPSGDCYWTVIDEAYEVMSVADRYLRDLRFGRDRTEPTTKAYAEGVSLYLRWCGCSNRQWHFAAGDLGLFVVWLRRTSTAPRCGPRAEDVSDPVGRADQQDS